MLGQVELAGGLFFGARAMEGIEPSNIRCAPPVQIMHGPFCLVQLLPHFDGRGFHARRSGWTRRELPKLCAHGAVVNKSIDLNVRRVEVVSHRISATAASMPGL